MHIKSNIFKSVYRLLFLICCEAGIILQYGFVSDLHSIAMLSCYYTIISNVICFLYFSYLLVARPKSERPVVKGAITMCIALTGIVYHLLLSGAMESSGYTGAALTVANQILHTVVPLMVFFDYLFFTPKGSFKSLDPLMWTLIPIAYLIFAMVRAEVSSATFTGFGKPSRYPYPFMDVDAIGAGKVALIIFIITVAYIAMGYLFYVADSLLGGKLRRK
ncbi:MAG: Pr6Pr family membrane protein [Oscillospiraceae bacterium]|nr:Pr6Pr family membrane protein [Oscillospiraceae bacterium]